MVAKLKTFLAGLSVTAILGILIALVFAGGELRQGLRAACGERSAGWLTRHACDWFDVVPPAPEEAILLPDNDIAERAETHTAPPGTTGQGLQVLDLKLKDLAELERLLARDLDGDHQVGHVTPRDERKKLDPIGGVNFEDGDLVFAVTNTPENCRGGTIVTSAPAEGGKVSNELIPNPVPDYEWLHEIDWELAGTLPLNGKELADSLKVSGRWTFARAHALHFALQPWWEKLPEFESEALGKETDWGVDGVLHLRCRGLFDCKSR